jgi:hypothetical protein
MRRYALVLLAAVLLAVYGISVVASAAPRPGAARAARCGPTGAHTLAATPVARIYVTRQAVYGCSGANGKSYRLGKRGLCLPELCVGRIALRGRIAAYELKGVGVDTSSAGVLVRSLANGRVLADQAAILNVPGPESFESVRMIVVKRDGAVAWIAAVSSIGHPSSLFEVHRGDRQGHALLDSGARIVPRSLRLHGSTITWTDAGMPRSATLS